MSRADFLDGATLRCIVCHHRVTTHGNLLSLSHAEFDRRMLDAITMETLYIRYLHLNDPVRREALHKQVAAFRTALTHAVSQPIGPPKSELDEGDDNQYAQLLRDRAGRACEIQEILSNPPFERPSIEISINNLILDRYANRVSEDTLKGIRTVLRTLVQVIGLIKVCPHRASVNLLSHAVAWRRQVPSPPPDAPREQILLFKRWEHYCQVSSETPARLQTLRRDTAVRIFGRNFLRFIFPHAATYMRSAQVNHMEETRGAHVWAQSMVPLIDCIS
jgi:hypothetical protein